jgi:2,4-dienoyl-CoA reductase-like NADH-dependent reductase (Old Yellow Enzyme family)
VAPSALPYAPDWQVPQALDKAGMDKIKADFVKAVKRCERVGYDLIEFHGGHGYLIHQFLSPLSNQRTDAYGGSAENTCVFRWKCLPPCARPGLPTSPWASGSRQWIGSRAA